MEDQNRRKRFNEHLLCCIDEPVASGRKDARDGFRSTEVLQCFIDARNIGWLNVQLQRLVGLECHAILNPRRLEHTPEFASKDARDGRFTCTCRSRKTRLSLLSHLEPALLRGTERTTNLAFVALRIIVLLTKKHRCHQGHGAVARTCRARSALPLLQGSHKLFVKRIENEAKKFLCVFLMPSSHQIEALVEAHGFIHEFRDKRFRKGFHIAKKVGVRRDSGQIFVARCRGNSLKFFEELNAVLNSPIVSIRASRDMALWNPFDNFLTILTSPP